MIGQKMALLTAAAALPLTALAAAPASAAQTSSSSDHPSVYIKHARYHDDYVNVHVKYRCYTEDSDDHDYRWGKLYVKAYQDDARYQGRDRAKCDGYWHDKWVYAYHRHGELEDGRFWVEAKVTDYDGDYDYDYRTFRYHH